MRKTNWMAIEADYLATGMPLTELAKKYGVSISTLKKKSAKGKWGEKVPQTALEAIKRTTPKKEPKKEPVPSQKEPWEIADPQSMAVEMRVERQKKLMKTTDAMMDRIISALDMIEPDNTYAIATLVKALKDLRDLQGLSKDQLDLEEQQARIAKLRSETRDQESENAGGVLLIPAIDEELQPPEEEKQ